MIKNMFDIELHNLVLAQSDTVQPASGGEALPPTVGGDLSSGGEGTLSPGGAGSGGTGGSPPGGGFGSQFLLIAGGMIVFMFIMSIMGQRRDRKKREALISGITKHDKVQTVGGVIGSVVEVKPDTIVLKVDESANTRITFARSAVQQVITSNESVGKAAPTELTTPN